MADSVTTTQWHSSWNLPLQRSEPGSIQGWTYDGKGHVLTERRQATTDANGAAGLSAVRTGSVTGRNISYGTKGLVSSSAELVDSVVIAAWTFTYNAQGDPTRLSGTEAGVTSSADLTSTGQGQLTRMAASNGALAAYSYAPRGGLVSAQLPDLSLSITRDARSLPTRIDTSAGTWLGIDYDAAGVPTQVTDSTGTVSQVLAMGRVEEPMRLATGTARPSQADRRTWLERLPLPAARAQPAPGMPQIIARGLSSGLPINHVRPADPFERAGCCGGAPPSPSFGFGSDFNTTTMAPPLLAYSVATSIISLAANDILIWASAYKLRRNMACQGITKPESGCCHAHHIVHRNGYDKGAVAESQAILAAAGIGIDDWENGVYVACAKHTETQNGAYDRLVRDELAKIPPASLSRSSVTAVLRTIAFGLRGGGC